MSTEDHPILNSLSVMIQTGIFILLLGVSNVTAADLALGQPANMTFPCESEAALAVEGTSAGCAVTTLLTDPWWRVDLGTSYVVDVVDIIAGADGSTDFEIRVGDNLDNEGNLNQKCGGPHTLTSSQEKSFFCTPGIKGRYVNIRIVGNNKKLAICEVSVNPNPTVNLALNKSASQSSVSFDGYPVRAVDGNTDSVWSSSSCTHTNKTTDPWWRADLGSSQHVSEVFIVNRVEAKFRLFNIEIRVGDSLANNGNSNPRCGGLHSMANLLKASFYCKPRKNGRYVNIRLVGSSMVLTLCEVEVYSESRGRYAMCTEFRDLVEGTRTVGHVVHNQQSAQNDGDIDNRAWYRFVSQATGTPVQLPDSCTEPWTCGTQASGWLRGGHPSMEEGLVDRNVCFSWNDNCCFAEVQALVRHCYGYYVYKLQPTALEFKVKARYCVENRAIPYEDALFYQPVTKTGVQSALTNHAIHTEYHVTSSWKCMAYCLSEMTCVSFSYFPQSNTCELNNSTESSNPEGLRERPETEYYEKTSHSSFLG